MRVGGVAEGGGRGWEQVCCVVWCGVVVGRRWEGRGRWRPEGRGGRGLEGQQRGMVEQPDEADGTGRVNGNSWADCDVAGLVGQSEGCVFVHEIAEDLVFINPNLTTQYVKPVHLLPLPKENKKDQATIAHSGEK